LSGTVYHLKVWWPFVDVRLAPTGGVVTFRIVLLDLGDSQALRAGPLKNTIVASHVCVDIRVAPL